MAESASERRRDPGLRELVARAREGFVIVGPDRTVRIMNEASERMLGIERAQVVGRPYPDPNFVEAIEAALESDATESLCIGTEVGEHSLRATVSRYGDADSAGAVIVIEDVTEETRKRDRFDAILAATGDGLVVTDAAGLVTSMNDAACELLGVPSDQAVGAADPVAALLGERSKADVADEHDLEIEEPESRVLHVRRDPMLDSHERFLGTVTTMRDVTTQREIMQMKNEFVSTVSHELRTPLTSIKGYIDLILDGDAGDVDEMQREFLGIVKENTDRLVELINEMLDISRIESGRIHLNVQPIDITESIRGAADTFRAVLPQKGHTLELDFPDDLPPVAGDRDRVGQVLINFMSNAIKYSPEGGTVIASARREDGEVVVGIKDQGIGIAEENLPQMFQQFYRVDSALTREIGGTGLGLSICKSIVDLLGGRIWVDTELGKGSTFYFTLPVAGPDLVRTPEVEGPFEATGGKVLVVDADPAAAALVETYLARHEYDVVKAYSATEALKKAASEQPDVIILDVILEDMDGFELLQRFKDEPPTASIPVVVLSVICDEGRSCRLGASRYLEKPIDKERLVRIINDTVGEIASPLILVVDDDRDIVDVLKRTLQGKGYAVAAAYDGREALASVDRSRPDLILLDLKMPEMDGYEVIRTLKTRESTRDIPIVVMTAHQLDSAQIDLIEMTTAQIAKPFEADGLAEHVAEMLNKEAFLAMSSRDAGRSAEPPTTS